MPVVYLRATFEQQGRFTPRSLMEKAFRVTNLGELGWIDRETDGRPKRLSDFSEDSAVLGFYQDPSNLRNETAVRRATIDSWLERQTRLVVIDDAHAITPIKKTDDPTNNFHAWMVAAEEIGTTIVFVGTGRLLSLWDSENEFYRRSKTIYVHRYRHDVEEDALSFARLVMTMADSFHWSSDFALAEHIEAIFHMTCGCIGEVCHLFEEAEGIATSRGSDAIGRSDFDAAAPNGVDLLQMARAIKRFEMRSSQVDKRQAAAVYKEVFGVA